MKIAVQFSHLNNLPQSQKVIKAKAFEENWDFDKMVQDCIEQTTFIVINNDYKNVENLF